MEKVTPVAGDQIVGIAGKRGSEYEVVAGIIHQIDVRDIREDYCSGS